MLSQISSHIKQVLSNFSEEDSIIFNNIQYKINKDNFIEIKKNPDNTNKLITFIDGGQAEILSTGNFCLSFIRVAAITFQNEKKIKQEIKEFFLFTKSVYKNNELYYESKIFGENIINEQNLTISSNDSTIKIGSERAPITKITNMARRFSELALANSSNSDYILLDGTLEKTFLNEEKYLDKLNEKLNSKVSALAKSSSLFTTSGNSPVILLDKIGPKEVF